MNNTNLLSFAIFPVILFCACAGWCLQRKRTAESELRAPLLLTEEAGSADARVESALRTAREGCRVCAKCTFENLAQSAFCAICGAVFTPSTKTKAGTTGGRLTTRQRRVQRRKEWVRSVANNGAVRWQTTALSEVSSVFAPWVLRLTVRMDVGASVDDEAHKQPEMTRASQDEVAIAINDEAVTPEAPQAPRVDDIATIAARLEACVAHLQVVVQDATVADAAVSTLQTCDDVSSDQRTQEIRDMVAQSQLDFPTKLAQFITATSTLFLNATTRDDGTTRASHLTIDHDTLVADSIASIARLTPTESRAAIRINFVGDQGVDAGGVYREWFLLFNEHIAKLDAGIFVCVDKQEQALYLNPHSREVLGEHHLAHIFAAGRVLGRALLDGNVTGFHLAHPLLKLILGLPISFHDLEFFDPETYKNLKWVLENDGVDALGLDFTVVEQLPNGTTRTVELIPGGGDQDVTDDNKREFVDHKVKYLLVDRVAPQLFAFLKGLYEVVSPELLVLFDVEELDFVLSGSDAIDVDHWRRHTKCTPDLVNHPAYKHFWELVREMTPEQRRLLLQFATGSSRVPPAGFSALSSYDGRLCPFTLYGVGLTVGNGYVRSHACFNRLDLPRLQSKQGMEQALSAALLSEDTGFTIQ